ncbi:MAG: pimeloyl-ACP methyl ester esterase BioH [Candidatus Contendobacter sp.]|jgi:pimeloyl-[acyl-carrier protein] methyl ester esterase|nr:pimeloyl-ACP methyl ester esterase BioH [Gammaproteobacteria bacterium]MCC8995431.1 pimeloyl-ACP methyl ester esterase BioH [Candidatus Contendobacter sp.]
MSSTQPDTRDSLSSPLYSRTIGCGPDVALIHGWGMHSGVWEDVVEALVDDYRVTAIDLPGHGYSREFDSVQNLPELAEAVAAVIPAPAIWIGWSLGGLVAQQVAISMPERVSRLALVNSTPCFIQRPDWPHAVALPVLRRFAEELRENHRAVLKRFIALEVHGSDHANEQYRQLKALLFQHGEPDAVALGDGLTMLEDADLRAELPRIQHPTLLLMGQRDQLTPAAAGEAMLKWLPNARLRIFERAGHAPFFSHLPDFMAELRAFLDA